MKLATLQFAPKLGDVEGNIRRADALLERARKRYGDDLQKLDLLALPEMAFTGVCFFAAFYTCLMMSLVLYKKIQPQLKEDRLQLPWRDGYTTIS